MAIALFFGPVSDAAGTGERRIPGECATVGAAFDWLCEEEPAFDAHRDRLRFAVNGRFVDADHLLESGDELSLLSPVSGG